MVILRNYNKKLLVTFRIGIYKARNYCMFWYEQSIGILQEVEESLRSINKILAEESYKNIYP